ncbi:hypothetical protein I306_05253 [Cryptococcus gattii EJB2]|uniref:Uncharacterized protein n=1 Tax=Cryptococcus gattii EJB2 TaxID=1296103 RepID=A0ABR5BPD0_9TREE|nr:hypothetical protein I306_05253 [Cryptococcus gattii EJB2]
MSQDNAPSLLIALNPALLQQKPAASILLNGPNRPRGPSSSTAPDSASPRSLSASSFTGSHSPVSSLTSVFSHASGSGEGSGSGERDSPSPPYPSLSPSSSHNSLHLHPAKQLGSNYTAPSSPAQSHSARRASHAKIHFAPLPVVPPELRRRNSISLGVASRRNLIGMQGPKGGVQSVVMNDEDWENYCKQFEEKHGNNDVIDVGQLAKSGAKALWRSVKRRRSGSQSSQNSTTSTSTTASTSAPPSVVSDSALLRHSLTGTPNSGSTHSLNGSLHLAPVREETEFALKSIPGSPPMTTIDDHGLPPMRVRAPVPRRPHSPRHLRAAHAMLHNSAMDTEMGMGDGDAAAAAAATAGDGDGDATPRRRPSPPPRLADTLPTEDELEQIADEKEEKEAQDVPATPEDEEGEGEGEEEMAEASLSSVAEGALGPEAEAAAAAEMVAPSSPGEHASIEGHNIESREAHDDRKRGRRSAVLGFDVERFGFMSIDDDKSH